MPGHTPQQKRLWKLLAAAFAILILLIGFVAGFFTAKNVDREQMMTLVHRHSEACSNAASNSVPLPFTRGMPVEGLELRQMPPPWSEEAQQTQFMPGLPDNMRDGLYTFYSDAHEITGKLTGMFLHQLQAHLNATGQSATSEADLHTVIDEFKEVALDVLSYLRHHNSQALLTMLRQFARQGSFTVTDIDPDVLRQELRQLMDLEELGRWYARVARKDHPSVTTRPVVGLHGNKATTELLRGSTSTTETTENGRRLLRTAHWLHLHEAEPAARHLHAAPAPPPASTALTAPSGQDEVTGAPIPVIPKKAAISQKVPPTVSPLMTLEEMLCQVQKFSPTGLEGMLVPNGRNSTTQGRPFSCQPLPEPGTFKYNQLVFRPVKIPVVFHCQRFKQGDVEMPPLWRAEEAAANLIKQANRAFQRALVQFELQEVRYDSKKYPYLLLGSLKDWQECTGHPGQEAAGFPCLSETAQDPAVAALTKKYVINVIVGGSGASPIFCNGTKDEVCGDLYSGYTGSIGPWFTRPSATWSESSLGENWVFISWDQFSPMVRNSKRFWDGGGVTFAHELGHYLGLMHTHEGTAPCEGDGLDKADAVPDTPVNRQTIQWASDNGLAVQLSRWCTQFREGKRPNPKALLVFKSCEQDPLAIDNVFNLLSYLPDQCCMLLTPNQVARLQWAIARFRPRMMAAYATK